MSELADIAFKIKLLFLVYLPDAHTGWRYEIWGKSLDDPICCDGRECGCEGVTIRESYKELNR